MTTVPQRYGYGQTDMHTDNISLAIPFFAVRASRAKSTVHTIWH